jgi:spermidine synthase
MRSLLCAFVGGFAVMGAEMAFARQAAPWFGSSLPVWAILISVLLSALSAGAAWGGLRTLKGRPPSFPGRLLVLAAAALVVTAFALPPLLAAAAGARQWGLAIAIPAALAALALAGTPMFLLGALPPALLAVSLAEREAAGWQAGRLSAAGTLGSLAGTLGAAFGLLPALGTRATGLVLAALCGVAALAARGLRPSPDVVAGLLLAAASAAAVRAGGHGPTPAGQRLREARQTSYQTSFVLEATDGTRSLRLNAMKDRHSSYDPRGPSSDGIWPYFLLAQAIRPGCARPPARVLVLGLGAGTLARDLEFAFPGAHVVGVEIDPEVIALGRRWFALPAATDVWAGDGRQYLNRPVDQRFDLILIDAFAGAYLPFQLATRESFQRADAWLTPGGAVAVNVLSVGGHRQLADAVAGTMVDVFGAGASADLRPGYNTMLLAWRSADAPDSAACAEPAWPAQRERLRALRSLVQPLPPRTAAAVLTDDHAPVEWLTHRMAFAALFGGDR